MYKVAQSTCKPEWCDLSTPSTNTYMSPPVYNFDLEGVGLVWMHSPTPWFLISIREGATLKTKEYTVLIISSTSNTALPPSV